MDDLDQVAEEGHYEDEDTRPTSRKELWGWYSYGWAAEVFAICAMGKRAPGYHDIVRHGLIVSSRLVPSHHSRATR